MTWRDRYRPASFRGSPFHVDSHDYETGRRAVVHELPQVEEPIVEDLGRSADRFRVTGYVLGPEYMTLRDRLIAVCRNRQGSISATRRASGTLVHPYLGTREVICLSCRVHEETREGGIARVELTFTEVGAAIVPFVPDATEGEADSAAETASDAAEEAAADELVATGPEFVREATAGGLASIAAALQKAQAIFTGPAAQIAAYASQVSAIASQAAALATAPADLVTSVRAAIDQVLVSVGNAVDALYVYETLFGLDPVQSGSGTSPAALAADANAAQVAALARRVALAGAVRAASRVAWDSLDAAQAARGRVAAQLDVELDAAPDDVYGALLALRATLTRTVPPPGQHLPRLATIELSAEEPALVTAWRLYADANRAGEIAARNGAPYPGFLPAGEPLEVLSA